MNLRQDFSRNLKARRKQLGWTQQELADKCRKTVRYVNHLENTGPNVTIDTLETLAKALDCTIFDLFQSARGKKRAPKTDLSKFYDHKETSSEAASIDFAIGVLKTERSKYK